MGKLTSIALLLWVSSSNAASPSQALAQKLKWLKGQGIEWDFTASSEPKFNMRETGLDSHRLKQNMEDAAEAFNAQIDSLRTSNAVTHADEIARCESARSDCLRVIWSIDNNIPYLSYAIAYTDLLVRGLIPAHFNGLDSETFYVLDPKSLANLSDLEALEVFEAVHTMVRSGSKLLAAKPADPRLMFSEIIEHSALAPIVAFFERVKADWNTPTAADLKKAFAKASQLNRLKAEGGPSCLPLAYAWAKAGYENDLAWSAESIEQQLLFVAKLPFGVVYPEALRDFESKALEGFPESLKNSEDALKDAEDKEYFSETRI